LDKLLDKEKHKVAGLEVNLKKAQQKLGSSSVIHDRHAREMHRKTQEIRITDKSGDGINRQQECF
jgi:hypothetical protein